MSEENKKFDAAQVKQELPEFKITKKVDPKPEDTKEEIKEDSIVHEETKKHNDIPIDPFIPKTQGKVCDCKKKCSRIY